MPRNRRRTPPLVLAALGALLSGALLAAPGGPVPQAPPAARAASLPPLSGTATARTLSLTVNGVTQQLGYCANASVEDTRFTVTDVVIVVHGDGRDACSYAQSIIAAATLAGRAGRTLVVAPHFPAAGDREAALPGRLYWSSSGWKSGEDSLTSPYARAWTLSSFAVVDLLVKRAADRSRYPNARTVVVAGHSAGAQFTHRYTAFTRVPPSATPGVTRWSVVANPSSYLYLEARRPDPDTGLLRPLTADEITACPGYNRYKYGFERLSGYVAATTSTAAVTALRTSTVRYLAGELDTDTGDSSLDTSCEGNWQGPQRLARAENYQRELDEILGAGGAPHALVTVPGVGHSARGMFTSPEGVAALFGG